MRKSSAEKVKRWGLIAFLGLFCIGMVAYLHAHTHRLAHEHHSTKQTVAVQTTRKAIPVLDGQWDLIWRDSTKRLQRIRICIRQDGTLLVIRSEGEEGNRRRSDLTRGVVTSEEISLTLRSEDGRSVTFIGKLQDGIVSGTTTDGLPWALIHHKDWE